MLAKDWLAHDGCRFLAAEERLGTEAALSWTPVHGSDSPRLRHGAL